MEGRKVRVCLPGEEEEGVEETRPGEADTRVNADREIHSLPDGVFDGLHEQVEASDRRYVQRQRHRRESHREYQLKHLKMMMMNKRTYTATYS